MKHYVEGSELNSIYDYPHHCDNNWKDCLVKKGDNYVLENNVQKIDFLKIDTEGSEQLVIERLHDTLKKGNTRVIQFEHGKINFYTHYCYLAVLRACK